jgi:hypothetical protein
MLAYGLLMHTLFDQNLFVSPPLCKTDGCVKEELNVLNISVHISARLYGACQKTQSLM